MCCVRACADWSVEVISPYAFGYRQRTVGSSVAAVGQADAVGGAVSGSALEDDPPRRSFFRLARRRIISVIHQIAKGSGSACVGSTAPVDETHGIHLHGVRVVGRRVHICIGGGCGGGSRVWSWSRGRSGECGIEALRRHWRLCAALWYVRRSEREMIYQPGVVNYANNTLRDGVFSGFCCVELLSKLLSNILVIL